MLGGHVYGNFSGEKRKTMTRAELDSKSTGGVVLVTTGEKLANRYLDENPDLTGFTVMGEPMRPWEATPRAGEPTRS